MPEDKPISEFTELITPEADDLLPIADDSDPSETKKIKVSNLKGSFGAVLAAIPNVNLMSIGDTLLYTVPAGKILIVTDVIVVNTNGDCTFGATVNIGFTSPNYDDVALDMWAKATLTNRYYQFSQEGDWSYSTGDEPKTVPAETDLYFRVTVAASGGAATVNVATICLVGYLL